MPDAVVIGAGPNGLVGANLLADAGWDVVVVEEQDEPGGAVKTRELTEPGYLSDVFSAFYPLAAASPVLRRLRLEEHGLRWQRGPLALAHPRLTGPCAVLSTDLDETASSLDAFGAGDGEAWRELFRLWEQVGDRLLDAITTPFPPWRAGIRLAAALGPSDVARFARLATLPVRRLAEERFLGEGAGRLLAGNALHADLPPELVGSGFYGWFLSSLGQQVGYPFPEGGAGRLTLALTRRLAARGGRVECGRRVREVVIRRGRAVAVRTADGTEFEARRAVLADTGAPQLYLDLVGRGHLSAAALEDLRRFHYDWSTIKVDWALDAPIPWAAPEARRSPVVHIAEGIDELTVLGGQLARGLIPDRPFLVVGQYSMGDPTRCPPGKEVAWAYARVPQRVRGDAGGELTGSWDELETDHFAARMERRIEELAPGFRNLIRSRHVLVPAALEAANRNLVGGAVNGGSAQLHQQLVFRPAPGLARPDTPIRGLYLASASAHPGGGVHGGPGANAAHAALAGSRRGRGAVVLGGAAAALCAAGARSQRGR